MASTKRPRNKKGVDGVGGDEEEDIDTVLCKHEYPVINPVEPIDGIPFGLELLVTTTHIFIRPSQELSEEGFSGNSEANHYEIIDCETGKIYFAWETDVTGLGKHRTFTLKVVDYAGRPVLQVNRNSNCLSCFLRIFNCCGSTGCTVTINTPDGTKLGELKQIYNGWTPKFLVRNEFEKQIMTINGPTGSYCCCNCNLESSLMIDAEFPILSEKEGQIGSISKGSPDPMEKVDTFGVRFPKELPVEQKATLLGSVFAINFMFFERIVFEPNVVEVYEENRKHQRQHTRRESYRRDLEALGLTAEGTAIEQPEPTSENPNS